MAEGFFNAYCKNDNYLAISAGTQPAGFVSEKAMEVMKEKGIDISKQTSKMLTKEMVRDSYRIYTMGCLENCPLTPKEKTIEWKSEDPRGQTLEFYRGVRDGIEVKVKELLTEIG
jgi:protein-tyrosine-phosphatase